MKKYVVAKFYANGKVVQVLESASLAVCKLFALQNVTPKGRTAIFDEFPVGNVLFAVQGTGRYSFPKVIIDHTKQ